MNNRTYLILAAAVPVLACLISVPCPAAGQAPTIEPMSEVLLGRVRPGMSREQYLADIVRPLRTLDNDQDGLDQFDVERQNAQVEARQRANAASEFLRFDFDGDLQLTLEEIQRYSVGSPEHIANVARVAIERFDTDENGIATLQEALTASSERARPRDASVERLFELDSNGDNRLTIDELLQAAANAFDQFDSDNDGLISSDEARAVQTERVLSEEIRRRREAGCVFQAPSADAQFIAYTPVGGQMISTSYVGHEEIDTSVIDVMIEPGRAPLYLLLKSHASVIWRFSGSVKRIEHVVVSSYASKFRQLSGDSVSTSASGVIGLPKGRTRIASSDCLPNFHDQTEIDAGLPQLALRALFGRAPDAIGRANPIRQVTFPSMVSSIFDRGDPPSAPEGFDPATWKVATRFYPGGLVQINPDDVTASEPVSPYEVYPNQFGLAQLVGSGHLTYSGPADGQGKYTIVRNFSHFPASMHGAHSAAFVLPEGIERPRGNVGHGCILSASDAAKPDWRRLCRLELVPVRKPAPVLRR